MQALQAQLEKDLGISLNSPEPQHIWNNVYQFCEQWEQQPSKIAQALYRVDLPETLVVEMYSAHISDPIGHLTYSILSREMQKIAHRMGNSAKQ